ncbi:GNAT family N-acetyltransferase [Chitinophaga sp.]|uniref:GNAT family N-acetyltransferase n=1 Tax=Chitinophaga sp. TaxID=1869181 RepID=UPI002F948883
MEIRDYKSGDENDIVVLFELVFGKPMPLSYWKWRFADNPCKQFMIKLMWNGDKLIGHYAVSPVELCDYQQTLLTGLSMTTMTHPDFTGLGIFPLLSESLYKDMQEKYWAAGVWGFPNNNSHRGFVSNLQWKDITVLPMFSCAIDKLTPKQDDSITYTRQFDKSHENAFMEYFADHLGVKKDATYLNWRYIDNPLNTYIVFDLTAVQGGFVVCKEYNAGGTNGKKQVDIIDWCVSAEAKMTKKVIQHLAASFPADKYSQLNMWMPLEDVRHGQLEKLGFANVAPVTYWSARSFGEKNLSGADNWWIQLGDSDVY